MRHKYFHQTITSSGSARIRLKSHLKETTTRRFAAISGQAAIGNLSICCAAAKSNAVLVSIHRIVELDSQSSVGQGFFGSCFTYAGGGAPRAPGSSIKVFSVLEAIGLKVLICTLSCSSSERCPFLGEEPAGIEWNSEGSTGLRTLPSMLSSLPIRSLK